MRRGPRGSRGSYEERKAAEKLKWVPKTSLGRKVLAGEIVSMDQIYEKNLAILEPEIVDFLLPNLQEEVLDIRMVQRSTDSGRKSSFAIVVAIGNKEGYVGIGTAKGLEVRPTIEKAVRDAKKNILKVKRGCGSWECGCDTNHSVPFRVSGKRSSTFVELIPAPKGTGITAGGTSTKVLELSGIKDVWSRTKGDTRTVFNAAFATVEALNNTRKMRVKT
jgi:small subunit ribosomal protein S5